ncbi:multicopper oxidase domain-containing protein [Sinomonas terrae]|uniref:Copper-containing nitrite reductase n=1 Tax=Sinomonas terrae TaxID=2908838 RepID=A0ABS9U755_9MICC|nr:multicopper oxidase domain-containing protein [Sinomonas terrae]MCH6472514.1 multicopper oxidase domain-containing protein [Sinomonas terrae]
MNGLGMDGPGTNPGGMTGRAGWHRWANIPTLGWLTAVAVLALAHRAVPDPAWLLVHLTLLGAVTNAIVVYSWHFSEALLRLPVPSRRPLAVRLVLLNLGAAAAMAGVVLPAWPLTVGGAAAVGVASAWHGTAILARARRALPSRFASTVRYYLASCAMLPFGAAAGAALAAIDDGAQGEWHARILVAHESLNVLGWVGLTVLGTLVTLLPTMLRTRADDAAEPTSRRALWLLLAGVLVATAGALVDAQWLTAAGIAAYLAGVLVSSGPLARTVARKAPVHFAPLSAVASVLWLVVALVWLLALCTTEPDWMALHDALGELTPVLAAGFAAQVLLGALAYLLPVVLGGGPTMVRARTAALDRGAWFRVILANGAILLYVLPVPSAVRVAAAAVGLIALCAFLWLVAKALWGRAPTKETPVASTAGQEARSRYGSGALGLALLIVAVVVGAAFDPSALILAQGSGSAASTASVTPTGHTTTVTVTMTGMHFSPASVTVPAGEHLLVHLHNLDPTPHDLTLANGKASPRVAPGTTADFDAGIITASVDGWCSVVGHKQMGMTFRIDAGTTPAASAPPFTPYPAALPPAVPGTVHRITLTVQDTARAVAPGVVQELWTYNGTSPGPILHGHVGDTFEITLVNHAPMGHSIDFHAGSVAPDGPMSTIAPGKTGTYTFTATAPGIWLYHCSTMPMSLHIANGMFGAVVIDPPDAPPVAEQFVLIQSELYYGQPTDGQPGMAAGSADPAKIAAEKPDAVVFNGYADQYQQAPLKAKAGEPVRIWVLDAGPDRPTSFHVVGGQFTAVWAEGTFRLAPGTGASQAMDLAPGQGGYVDLTFPEAGHYPFVTHYMVDAEHGAQGTFDITAGTQ